MKITQEKARVFAINLSTAEINEYIREHQTEYETWLTKKTANKQKQEVAPNKRITSQRGVR